MSIPVHQNFQHTWSARPLTAPPLIAPARQFTYPVNVPGEEDALQRGALLVEVRPSAGGTFLATAALGFRDPGSLSALYACPNPNDLLILSGGYAYLIDTLRPETCEQLPCRPATSVLAAPEEGLLLLADFWGVLALDAGGLKWQSKRISAEGVTMHRVENGILYGLGWKYDTNADVPFTLDLRTGEHEGGGFTFGGWR